MLEVMNYRDYRELKTKLSNSLIKRKRALGNNNVDPDTGYSLEEIDEFIKLICEEIMKLPILEDSPFWVKELRLNARSILNGRLERRAK